jgi:hypothetical protein
MNVPEQITELINKRAAQITKESGNPELRA